MIGESVRRSDRIHTPKVLTNFDLAVRLYVRRKWVADTLAGLSEEERDTIARPFTLLRGFERARPAEEAAQ
jgi:hypothetical protein